MERPKATRIGRERIDLGLERGRIAVRRSMVVL
jgi:hypothetical protein